MSEPIDAGTSSSAPPLSPQRPTSSSSSSRRRSSSTRSGRSRPIRPRATSSLSQRSDVSNISSGIQQLSWTTGDCYDYVDDDARISAFLHCPICLGPFFEPYASTVCSHTFCQQCITTALSTQQLSEQQDDPSNMAAATRRCPTCRTTVDLDDFQPTALLIKNMVDTLRVRCPNKEKGCQHECERHLLRGHVASECAFEYVDADLNERKRCGCSAKVMRKDWASHGLNCPKRNITCPTCDMDVCFDELEAHSRTCSPEPVVCEFCRMETIKSRLALHLTNDCQEAPVLCPHSSFGCGWMGPRRRLSRLPDTASKSTEHTHLEDECRFEPIKAFFSIFSQHINHLEDENAALKARLDEVQSRQHGQARRIDDCVHSLGSWYRSAGELRSGLEERARGSQMGVDGEWDEFPLDAQNWERSLSQQSFGARQTTRTQSASAVSSTDLATWARRQYRDLASTASDLGSRVQSTQRAGADASSSRYLVPPTARSMPSSTSGIGSRAAHTPSPTHDRLSYLSSADPSSAPRRSYTPTTNSTSTTLLTPLESTASTGPTSLSPLAYSSFPLPIPDDDVLDRSNLDSALASLTASLAGLSSGLSSLDKRTEEGHIAAVKAGFDAGRVTEEVASLRHGLHAVRMQMHQMLMTQQRHALFAGPSAGVGAIANLSPAAAAPGGAGAGAGAPAGEPVAGPSHSLGGALPILTPPLLRRWAGLEHTKL